MTFIVTPAFVGLGPGGAPLLFAGTNVLSLLIVIAFVPETNNKSLETLNCPADSQSDARSLKVIPGPDVLSSHRDVTGAIKPGTSLATPVGPGANEHFSEL